VVPPAPHCALTAWGCASDHRQSPLITSRRRHGRVRMWSSPRRHGARYGWRRPWSRSWPR
jgi:hypothetical protein